uniref:Chromosome 16 open reading frame 89 n=1 Tax=Podarcis muralis TaxID=64176 RepID=A0A670JWJ2_PODMU
RNSMLFLRFQLLIFLLNLNLSRCEDKRNLIISALEKATLFLEEQYNELNIDGVLGYRLLQAYLNGTMEKWAPEAPLFQVITMVSLAQYYCLQTKSLQNNNKLLSLPLATPSPFAAFHQALSPGFWKIPHQWAQNDPPVSFSPTNGSCLDLETSDYCLSILAGGTPCLVPDNCRSIMIKTHCSGYGLSHQLFYFLFAEMKGCSDPLFHNAQYYKSVFCHLMMQINVDAEKQALLGTVGDLFTENSKWPYCYLPFNMFAFCLSVMFCGLAGFSDFYKPRWLDIILNWQKRERGCFWIPVSEDHHKEARRVKRTEKILEGKDNGNWCGCIDKNCFPTYHTF